MCLWARTQVTACASGLQTGTPARLAVELPVIWAVRSQVYIIAQRHMWSVAPFRYFCNTLKFLENRGDIPMPR